MNRWHWGEPLTPLRAVLGRSGVLFVPTESSYGIAVDPRNPKAVDAVYRLKGRDAGKALLAVVESAERLRELGVDPSQPAVKKLCERVWPGPVTAILPTSRPLAAGAGTGTLAVRIPAHRRLRELIADLDLPLTATSANLSGASPVLEPRELDELFPDVDGIVVDDGRLPGGPPSTMVAPGENGWILKRVGNLSRARLEELLGEPVRDGRQTT